MFLDVKEPHLDIKTEKVCFKEHSDSGMRWKSFQLTINESCLKKQQHVYVHGSLIQFFWVFAKYVALVHTASQIE